MDFLPVGHTHENVDQMFSCISREIKMTDLRTPIDLVNAINRSYKHAQPAEHITAVYDFRALVKSTCEELHQIKEFQSLLFQNMDGAVTIW